MLQGMEHGDHVGGIVTSIERHQTDHAAGHRGTMAVSVSSDGTRQAKVYATMPSPSQAAISAQ